MNDAFTWLGSNDKMLTMAIAFIGWIVAGTMAWSNIRWRIKNLENGHSELQGIIKKQVELTRTVELNSVELKQIAIATEKRLQLIENRAN